MTLLWLKEIGSILQLVLRKGRQRIRCWWIQHLYEISPSSTQNLAKLRSILMHEFYYKMSFEREFQHLRIKWTLSHPHLMQPILCQYVLRISYIFWNTINPCHVNHKALRGTIVLTALLQMNQHWKENLQNTSPVEKKEAKCIGLSTWTEEPCSLRLFSYNIFIPNKCCETLLQDQSYHKGPVQQANYT